MRAGNNCVWVWSDFPRQECRRPKNSSGEGHVAVVDSNGGWIILNSGTFASKIQQIVQNEIVNELGPIRLYLERVHKIQQHVRTRSNQELCSCMRRQMRCERGQGSQLPSCTIAKDKAANSSGIAGRHEKREPGREDEDPLVVMDYSYLNLDGTEDDDDDEDDEVVQDNLTATCLEETRCRGPESQSATDQR